MFITVKFIEDIIFSREMQNTECTYEEWIVWNKHYTFKDVLKVQMCTYAYSTIYGRYKPQGSMLATLWDTSTKQIISITSLQWKKNKHTLYEKSKGLDSLCCDCHPKLACALYFISEVYKATCCPPMTHKAYTNNSTITNTIWHCTYRSAYVLHKVPMWYTRLSSH